MLYIDDRPQGREHIWHVGDPLPHLHSRVLKLQADGHELEALLIALRDAQVLSNGAVALMG